MTVERRSAPRYPLVLAMEVVELPRGAKLSARTSDVSRTGCYIDTLNPIPKDSQIRLRIRSPRSRRLYKPWSGYGHSVRNCHPRTASQTRALAGDPRRILKLGYIIEE